MSEKTEKRIFEAAKEEFAAKGYQGARMQHIADRAGINKSMLHYYYRSKARLFRAVFEDSIHRIFPRIPELWKDDLPIVKRFEHFVSGYLDLLGENPHLPGFIVFELQQNPLGVRELFRGQLSGHFERLAEDIETAARKGEIRPVDPAQMLVSVLSVCVFPVVARPIIEEVTGMTGASFARFLQQRKQFVFDLIHRALVP